MEEEIQTYGGPAAGLGNITGATPWYQSANVMIVVSSNTEINPPYQERKIKAQTIIDVIEIGVRVVGVFE